MLGPKKIRTAYSQVVAYGPYDVLWEALGLDFGFPPDWDIGDPSDYGTSDPWPEGLMGFKLSVPSQPPPSFEKRIYTLGFSGPDSFFDIDSYTAGGLSIEKDFTEQEVNVKLRAFNWGTGEHSELRILPNSIQLSADSLSLPTIDDLNVVNINGNPYVVPFITGITPGNGLDLDGFGVLSFDVNTGSWGGSSSSSVNATSTSFVEFDVGAGGTINSPGFAALYLASLVTNLQCTTGTSDTEIVEFAVSFDGGANWQAFARAPVVDGTVVPFTCCVPLSIAAGSYAYPNLQLGVRSVTGGAVSVGGVGNSRFNLFPVT